MNDKRPLGGLRIIHYPTQDRRITYLLDIVNRMDSGIEHIAQNAQPNTDCQPAQQAKSKVYFYARTDRIFRNGSRLHRFHLHSAYALIVPWGLQFVLYKDAHLVANLIGYFSSECRSIVSDGDVEQSRVQRNIHFDLLSQLSRRHVEAQFFNNWSQNAVCCS